MRLIDADALRKWFVNWLDANMGSEPLRYMTAETIELIDDAPTIEAESVVHCKECEHGDDAIPAVDGVLYCNMWGACTTCDGYCHHAKMDGGV